MRQIVLSSGEMLHLSQLMVGKVHFSRAHSGIWPSTVRDNYGCKLKLRSYRRAGNAVNLPRCRVVVRCTC